MGRCQTRAEDYTSKCITLLGGQRLNGCSHNFLLVLKRRFLLFYRAAHAGNEVALKEQENQHYRDNGNQNGSGKLVVLGGELGVELNESKGQRPVFIGAQKYLSQDKLVPCSNAVENAERYYCRQGERQGDTIENAKPGTAVNSCRLNNGRRNGSEETPHDHYPKWDPKTDVKDYKAREGINEI